MINKIINRVGIFAGVLAILIALVTGIIAIFIGISFWHNDLWDYGRDITFGADFYTEIFDAANSIRNMLPSFNNNFVDAFGWIFILIGLGDISISGYFLMKFCKSINYDCKQKNSCEEIPQENSCKEISQTVIDSEINVESENAEVCDNENADL